MHENQRDIKSKRTIKLARLNLASLAARQWHEGFACGKRYRVHIGAYRNETNAHRAHHLLEQLDHYLLNNVFFNVEPQQRRTTIYYDLVSAPLRKNHLSAL